MADIVEKSKVGRPAWTPDAQVIAQVEAMGGRGLTIEEIARNLGISVSTLYHKKRLYKQFSEAIKRGAAHANLIAVNGLFKQVQDGNLVAQIYWTKARMGWRDSSSAIEVSGPGGGPVELTAQRRLEDEGDRYERRVARARELLKAALESGRVDQLTHLNGLDDSLETTADEVDDDGGDNGSKDDG